MPQMYPMSWFMFSFILLLLMSMPSNVYNYSNKTNKKDIFIFCKNVKWLW